MFAKLRAASGSVCKSRSLTTAWCTTLTRSIGCVVIEELCPCTLTLSGAPLGFNVTKTSRIELTRIETSEFASANFAAFTVTR